MGRWAHGAGAGRWSSLHSLLLPHAVGSGWAPWLQEEELRGVAMPALDWPQRPLPGWTLLLCASIARIFQAAIAMVTLEMVLVQGSQSTQTQKMAFLRWEQGSAHRASGYPGMWLL